MTTRYTAAQVIEALKAHRGVYLTAKHLRVSPSTVYGYMRRWPTVKAAWQALDGEVTDVAEAALYRAIIAGEPWAVKFQLATKGKDRGYTERHEVESVGVTEIQLTWGDDRRADNPNASALPGADRGEAE